MSAILTTNFDTSKIFVWNNRFQKVTYTNPTGGVVNLLKGTVMGRITATQKALPSVSTATDGSQQPYFICADDYAVAAGATIEITVCDGGDVDQTLLKFSGAETLNTVITDDVSMRSAIERNAHIKLVGRTDHTGFDNQ